MNPENASSVEALYLLQFTDTHYYDDPDGALKDIHTVQSLDACLEHARKNHPGAEGILATGDLSHESSGPAFERLGRRFQEYGLPVYAIPGNHDDVSLLSRHMETAGIKVLGNHLLKNWHLVMLDSVIPRSEGGRLEQSELERLKHCLEEHPNKPTLVSLHHQPCPVGSKWLDTMVLENSDAFFSVIDEFSQVRIVLFGHVHQVFEARRNHASLLASPSTCVQFKPCSDDFALDTRPPGYRWIKLEATGEFTTGVEWVS